MDEKQLQILANELAKNLKTPEDLSLFEYFLKKISVEVAFNAEMTRHLDTDFSLSNETSWEKLLRIVGAVKLLCCNKFA
ncbi:TPA: hypothetical protein ACHYJP_004267, partial [Escherichia coli]